MWLLSLDQQLTNSFYDFVWSSVGRVEFFRFLATYPVYLLPIMLLALYFSGKRLTSAKIFIGTFLTWKVYSSLIGSFFYNQFGFRDRPFAGRGFTELYFEQPQKAFPSDHSAVFMFVTLILFHYRQKNWAWVFLGLTIISTFARVGIGFHWFGDILGGLVVGALGFLTIIKLDKILDRQLNKISFIRDASQLNS